MNAEQWKKCGGNAFPSPTDYGDSWNGLTKRDVFATAAMSALLHDYWNAEGNPPPPDKEIAFTAYRLADAMLAERSK